MRILPIGIRFATGDLGAALENAHLASQVTHGHPRSQIACGIYVAVARRLLSGQTPEEAYRAGVAESLEHYEPSQHRGELHTFTRLLDGRLPELAEGDIRSDGYVVHTLEAACGAC